jgi:Zn-finger protein
MEAAKLTGKPAVAPYSGEVWDLAECSLIHKAEIVPVIRKAAQGGGQESSGSGHKVTESTQRAVSAYTDLRETGEKLMQLIDRCQGRSNKHLRAFAAEIEALIKKWG